MIIKGYIENTLKELDNLYNKPTSLKKKIYYSKLAIIELCGWIEESCDAIVNDTAKSKLKTSEFKDILKNTIKRNYGFKYKENFRPMLITSFGLVKIEEIQTKLEQNRGQISLLESNLNTLTTLRNQNAHTFLRGTTTTIQTPSITLTYFHNMYSILKQIEAEVKNI